MQSEYGISLYFRDSSSIFEEIVEEINKFPPKYVLVDDETPPNEDCFLLLYRLISTLSAQITFGTSITNPFSRHPINIVFSILSMIKHYKIQFLLGIGNGSNSRRDALGVKSKDYKQEMIEAINIIKNLFEGKRMDFDGQHFSCHSSIPENLMIHEIPKIFLAARGNRMLDLSTKIADGVFGVYYPFQEYIEYFNSAIREGLEKQSKKINDFTCALWIPIYVNPPKDLQQKITYHCKKRWEITPNVIKKLLNSKNTETKEFLNKLVVQGDIDDCASQIRSWKENIPIIPFFAINESNYSKELFINLKEIVTKI